MLPHPLTNFEIQRYYQNESRFNGIYLRDNLPNQIKDGAYVINLRKYANVGTHQIALFVVNNDAVYFDNFRVELILREVRHFIGNESTQISLFRIQAFGSVMQGYI